jgi:hypothetical protein
MNVIVCPFCLTLFLSDVSEEDDCPRCGVGRLISYEDYVLRINSSFMELISEERWKDDTGQDGN